MELSFLDLKEREIINVFDGKKLGRVVDIVFNNETGVVRGIVVPGDKKIFRKDEDIFIPIDKIKRIGNDVILVGFQREDRFIKNRSRKDVDKNIKIYEKYYNRNYSGYESEDRFGGYKNNNYNLSSKNSDKFYNTNQDLQKYTNNKKISQQSFVRMRPIDRKKYK